MSVVHGLLHPKARGSFLLLRDALLRGYLAGECDLLFEPFEGWRDPERQAELLGKGTTKAGPWESAHNYGLAVDYWPRKKVTVSTDGNVETVQGWDFSLPADDVRWNFLSKKASDVGLLNNIKWDRPHVQHPLWNAFRQYVL